MALGKIKTEATGGNHWMGHKADAKKAAKKARRATDKTAAKEG